MFEIIFPIAPVNFYSQLLCLLLTRSIDQVITFALRSKWRVANAPLNLYSFMAWIEYAFDWTSSSTHTTATAPSLVSSAQLSSNLKLISRGILNLISVCERKICMAIYKSIHYPYVWSWSMCGLELQLVGCLLLQLLCWLAGMDSWRRVGWLGRYCGCLIVWYVHGQHLHHVVAVRNPLLLLTSSRALELLWFVTAVSVANVTVTFEQICWFILFSLLFLWDFRCLPKKRFSHFSGNDIISTKCWCNICRKCPP